MVEKIYPPLRASSLVFFVIISSIVYISEAQTGTNNISETSQCVPRTHVFKCSGFRTNFKDREIAIEQFKDRVQMIFGLSNTSSIEVVTYDVQGKTLTWFNRTLDCSDVPINSCPRAEIEQIFGQMWDETDNLFPKPSRITKLYIGPEIDIGTMRVIWLGLCDQGSRKRTLNDQDPEQTIPPRVEPEINEDSFTESSTSAPVNDDLFTDYPTLAPGVFDSLMNEINAREENRETITVPTDIPTSAVSTDQGTTEAITTQGENKMAETTIQSSSVKSLFDFPDPFDSKNEDVKTTTASTEIPTSALSTDQGITEAISTQEDNKMSETTIQSSSVASLFDFSDPFDSKNEDGKITTVLTEIPTSALSTDQVTTEATTQEETKMAETTIQSSFVTSPFEILNPSDSENEIKPVTSSSTSRTTMIAVGCVIGAVIVVGSVLLTRFISHRRRGAYRLAKGHKIKV